MTFRYLQYIQWYTNTDRALDKVETNAALMESVLSASQCARDKLFSSHCARQSFILLCTFPSSNPDLLYNKMEVVK